MTTPVPNRLPVPGGLQLTLRMSYSGQDSVVVLGGFGGDDGPSATIATKWRDHAWESFAPLVAGAARCTGAILRDASVADGLVFEVGPPTSDIGSGGGGGVLLAACTLIKWSTTKGGRSGKGRTFLPAVPLSNINGDGRTYASTVAAKVQTAVANYTNQTKVAAVGVAPAVLSFTDGDHGIITSGGLAPVVGLQRRRMR